MGPRCELAFDCIDHSIKKAKVAVVQAQPAGEFPDSFDRIELRTVGRQEVQSKRWGLRLPPSEVELGSMVLRVVADRHHTAACNSALLTKHLEEFPEGLAIESARLSPNQELAVSQADGCEVPNALPRRVMIQYRILDLGRHPHPAPRSLLLKVDFVQRPEIDTLVEHQFAEFFLCAFCFASSALANTGLGLRSRKSKCRNKR